MRPRQRPDDLDTTPSSQRDPVAREASGGGGKGGPLEAGKENDAKIQRSLSKKSGWGYYDPITRERVPWYIDMINGGGMNAAGDTFEGGFGLPAVAGGVMNQLGIKPYGADRGRAYMPMEAWRGGDYTIGAQPAQPPAPAGLPTPVRTGPAPSYATMDMGEVGRGANVGLQNIPPAYGYGGNRPMANPLANMPATQYMQQTAGTPPSGLLSGMMAAQGATEPDFVAGSQNQQAYRDALAAMQGRMDISKMPMDQLQQYMRLYRQGGPRR